MIKKRGGSIDGLDNEKNLILIAIIFSICVGLLSGYTYSYVFESINETENDQIREEDIREVVTKDSYIELEDIMFKLPAGWFEYDMSESDIPVIYYISGDEYGTNFNIVVEELPEYIDYDIDTYIKEAHNNTSVIYTDSETYDKYGMRWNRSITRDGNTYLEQISFIHKNKAYIFNYGSLSEEALRKKEKEFDKVLESIVLK